MGAGPQRGQGAEPLAGCGAEPHDLRKMLMMDLEQSLEYPLPRLSVVSCDLTIDESTRKAMIKLKNVAGGTLVGKIVSSAKCLKFEPEEWSGNRAEIVCVFSFLLEDKWYPGDTRSFRAVVKSNGGEEVLQITARLAKMSIRTKSNSSIATLADFFAYAQVAEVAEIAAIFTSPEFAKLLTVANFPYIDVYKTLITQSDLPKALDDFFILAGLKKHTDIFVAKNEIEHNSIDNGMIQANFIVEKSDAGHVDAKIVTSFPKSHWLTIKTKTVKFNENKAEIRYAIDPLLITNRYVRERIIIQTPARCLPINIVFKRSSPFTAVLNRQGFTYNDNGFVTITTPLKRPLKIHILSNSSFVRFYQLEYSVDGEIKIPFTIKLPTLQAAQMLFRKIPALSATINIKAEYKGKIITKSLKLTAGEF